MDPRRAVAEAVPMVKRQKLPPRVVELLEERIATKGDLNVYVASPDSAQRGEPPVVRYAHTSTGRTFEAFVYGRRAQDWRSKSSASLIGVAMDSVLALSESPVRRLEVGEIPDARRAAIEVCPVSKKETQTTVPPGMPVDEALPVAEANDQLIYFCDGAHISVYEQNLIMAEAGTGGAQGFTGGMPAAAVPSVGVVKVLYVPVIFADQGQVPASEATLHDTLRQVAEFYQTQSYGKLTLVATVTPPVRLPRNQAWYKGKDTTEGFIKEVDGLGAEMAHAKEAARQLGYDHLDYHCFMLRDANGPRAPTSFGSIGSGQVWMRGDSASTAAHEIGHAFGLLHANFWLTNGASTTGPGGNEEYGNSYDNMGSTSPPAGHYNVQAKNQVKWLPDEYAPPITQSGIYRIHAFDTPRIEPGKRYGLRVVKDAERTYWGEYRTLFPSNPWVTNGMLLGWKWSANSGGNIQLLDVTPGSINGKNDAPIVVGATFSDVESGIHITTTAVNPNTNPPSLDVAVNLGSFPGNQPPTATLATSAAYIPTATPVTFTVDATDPDGDTLCYAWLWHDSTTSPNAPVVTRSFAAAGVYTVNCVVSDMKGGTTVKKATITVGNGAGRFTISGRITRSGAPAQGINVTTGGTNGTLTDSDGRFTIANLVANTYTVTPAGHGMQFNELFNNSVAVGPSFEGANFEVIDLPTVTLTAPTPVAVEGGASGMFRLTRTGDTSQALSVYVLTAQGTAMRGTDYNFSPTYTAVSGTPYQIFTIPADSASLDILVSPINDSMQESDETVTLVMGLDSSYVNASPVSASVAIQDDDTMRPRVSLRLLDSGQVIEGQGEPVRATLTRTGATTSALSVPLAVSAGSTATAGVDYTALAASYNIPAGSSSVDVLLQPINDAEPEGTEMVVLSITSDTNFIADAVANTATARFLDDDTQTVSLVVTNPTATEVDRSQPGAVANPGLMMITRSGGDTSAPLRVYYSVAGTALHGVDYEALAGSVVIPAGKTQVPLIIMPRPDTIGEAPETVIVALAAGNPGYLPSSTASSGTITIQNANAPPLLEVTANSSTLTEGGASGTFRITAKGTGTNTITINYIVSGTATPGTDYTTLSGSTTLTLNNGTVTGDITVAPLNDTALEEVETITLTLSPSSDYSLWETSRSATLLLRDDDQPTVYADGQVGTGSGESVAESATGTACKFWISRTGVTSSALSVRYSLTGTATNGTDHTTLSGTATIPIGAPGVDVTFNTLQDTTFEGTETVRLKLEPGTGGTNYARGPDATIYITDDDTTSSNGVAFTSTGSTWSEGSGTFGIPVSLSSPATAPVTVDYSLDTGPRTTTFLNGNWLRLVRTGSTIQAFTSPNGVTWTPFGGAQSHTIPSANYLVGIAASTISMVRVDNVSVTGLSNGGSLGSQTAVNIGSAAGNSTHVEANGVYSITAGGTDLHGTGTTDALRYIYFNVSNSDNCTITARIANITSGSIAHRAGLMIRSTTAPGSMHVTSTQSLQSTQGLVRRSTTDGAATVVIASSGGAPSVARPVWLRLTRTGPVFSAFYSTNGTTFTPLGVQQTLDFSSNLLVGLCASSRSDGNLSRTTFDNLTLSPAPSTPLEGRNIGFVGEDGSATVAGGVYTVLASGTGFLTSTTSTEDEGYLVGTRITGDFSITTRLTDIQGGATNADAGLMVRESENHRSRCLSIFTLRSSTSLEFRGRLSSTTTGEGAGVDYAVTPGTLTFNIGEQTKTIDVSLTDDALPEPPETAVVTLRNANGAMLGVPASHTFTILDDDSQNLQPVISFAAGASSVGEDAGSALIPVVLSQTSPNTVTINYTCNAVSATPGSDFTSVSGTLVFPPGEVMQTISIPVLQDSVAEAGETLQVEFSAPVLGVLGTLATHVLTITDDDTPVVSVQATANAMEVGASGMFTFTRTGPTTAALTVNFTRSGTATSGIDFNAFSPSSSITFPAGAANVSLAVNPRQDGDQEANETVILTLTTGSAYSLGTPSSATVTIADDDLNTITVEATDADASEAAGNPGSFTLRRTGPLSNGLFFSISLGGTATIGTDYSPQTSLQQFAADQSTITLPISVLQDTVTEGTEVVMLSIVAGSNYIVGTPSIATVTIRDDDLPPTVYISSPATKSSIVATGHGMLLEATAEDDGLPQALGYNWTQTFGPGVVTFETPLGRTTAASFPVAGVYGLRIMVNDGQFTATDDVFVQVGGFTEANWISMQHTIARSGVSGESAGGNFSLLPGAASGGYTGTADTGLLHFRQMPPGTADTSITARITTLGPSTPSQAGVAIRETSRAGSRRVALIYNRNGTLQFHARGVAGDASSVTASQTNLPLPLWVKLERVGSATTGSYALDVDGVPGTWVSLGLSSVPMGTRPVVGMVASNSTAVTLPTRAGFDNVLVTPTPVGSALNSEDLGAFVTTGSSSESAGTTTVNGTGSHDSSGGHYRYRQVWGDCMVTVRLLTHSGSTRGAQSGVMIRDTADPGPFAFYGITSVDGFQAHWRSSSSGSVSTLQTSGSTGNWLRLVRRGTSVVAYRAPNVSGAPGAWAQASGVLPVPMTGAMMVGLLVDSNNTSLTATGTFSNLTIEPLNTAPVLTLAETATAQVETTLPLQATVADDGQPIPPGAVTVGWSQVSGPATGALSNAAILSPDATFPVPGAYQLRLTADDGDTQVYRDTAITILKPYQYWLHESFAQVGGHSAPGAAWDADPDQDGLINLLEYSLGTETLAGDGSPSMLSVAEIEGERFLQISVDKNPTAQGVQWVAEATDDPANPAAWASEGVVVETNSASQYTARDHVPMNDANRRFMRVRVVLVDP